MRTMTFSTLLADVPIGEIGRGPGVGPWGSGATSGTGAIVATIVSNTIGFLTIIAGIWFIFQFIVGAYQFLDAGGEPERLQKAKKRLTNAILGLTVVVAAYAITSLLGKLLGLKFILDPESVINLLTP